MGYTKSPCYGCGNRTAECHSACPLCAGWVKLHAEEKARADRGRRIDSEFLARRSEVAENLKKRYRSSTGYERVKKGK